MKKGFKLVLLFCGFVFLTATAATAAPICVSVGGLTYRMDIGVAGDAIIVNGVRYSTKNLPLVGSGFIRTDGSVVIGLTEQFDYASGSWTHPIGITILRISGGSFTYDRTYFGNPAVLISTLTGTFTTVTCPTMTIAPPGPDPNAK